MKLIYAYIRRFRNIFKQGINFSNELECSFVKGKLSIVTKQVPEYIDAIYGDSILKNVHVIVGKTGSGKTNLLQLIGMDEYRREDEPGEYFLLYREETTPDAYVIELFNFNIDIPISQNRHGHYREECGMYRIIMREGKVSELVSIDPSDCKECLVVNCFDKHSFSYFPYPDVHQEGFNNHLQYLRRLISPYSRTNIGIACEVIQRYISTFPGNSVKRKAALRIKSLNWSNQISSSIDEDLLKEQYWTYYEIGLGITEGINKKVIESAKNKSPKEKFLHDLLADYALYMREHLEGFSKKELERDLDEGVYDGTIGLSNQINAFHTPDHWGNGSIRHLIKRITWLAKVIDRHTDPEFFPTGEGLVWQISSDIIDIYNLLKKMPDKYFNPDLFSIPIGEIEMGEEDPMGELFERMTGYRPDEAGLFERELLPYQISGLSSGEYQYAKVLGAIDEYCIRLKLGTAGSRRYMRPDFILLLDEPETYMHPDLARCFFKEMDTILRKHKDESNIQIIMTTHSPFMLSDMTSGQVTKLDFDYNGCCKVIPVSKETFASSIYSIMANEFFLNYSIGEFSRIRLSGMLEYLKNSIQTEYMDENDKALQEIRAVMPVIADPLLRRSFEILFEALDGTPHV